MDLKKSRRSYPFPPATTRPIILIVTVDGSTVVPEFGGWACYDHNTHRWLTPDHIKTLVASWFQQHCADYSGKTLDHPLVIESFARSSHRPDWEFLETPREVSMGLRLKNGLNRIDAILDVSWERHQEHVLRNARLSTSA